VPASSGKGGGEALEGLRAVRGVSWQWRERNPAGLTGSDAGVIAQEVEAVFPELVATDERGFKTVSYGGLVAVLIEAVKELDARLQRLEDLVEGDRRDAGSC
jgi:hypothetical protein